MNLSTQRRGRKRKKRKKSNRYERVLQNSTPRIRCRIELKIPTNRNYISPRLQDRSYMRFIDNQRPRPKTSHRTSRNSTPIFCEKGKRDRPRTSRGIRTRKRETFYFPRNFVVRRLLPTRLQRPVAVVPISFKKPKDRSRRHVKDTYVSRLKAILRYQSQFTSHLQDKKTKVRAKKRRKKKRKQLRLNNLKKIPKKKAKPVHPFWGRTVALKLDPFVDKSKRKYSKVLDSGRDPLKVTLNSLKGYYEDVRDKSSNTAEFLRRVSRPRNEMEVDALKDIIDEENEIEKCLVVDNQSGAVVMPKIFS